MSRLPLNLSVEGSTRDPGAVVGPPARTIQWTLASPAGQADWHDVRIVLQAPAAGESSETVAASRDLRVSSDLGPVESSLPTAAMSWVELRWEGPAPVESLHLHTAHARNVRVSIFGRNDQPQPHQTTFVKAEQDQAATHRLPPVHGEKILLEFVKDGTVPGTYDPDAVRVHAVSADVSLLPAGLRVGLPGEPPFFVLDSTPAPGDTIELTGAADAITSDGTGGFELELTAETAGALKFVEASFAPVRRITGFDERGDEPYLVDKQPNDPALVTAALAPQQKIIEVTFDVEAALRNEDIVELGAPGPGRFEQICDVSHEAAQVVNVQPESPPPLSVGCHLVPRATAVRGTLGLHEDDGGRPAENPIEAAQQDFLIQTERVDAHVGRWIDVEVSGAEPVGSSLWLVCKVAEGIARWSLSPAGSPEQPSCQQRTQNASWLPRWLPPEDEETGEPIHATAHTRLRTTRDEPLPALSIAVTRGSREIERELDGSGTVELTPAEIGQLNEDNSLSLRVRVTSPAGGEVTFRDVLIRTVDS